MRITKGKVFFLIILTIAVLWLASVAIKSYKPNPISGGILKVGTSAVAPLQKREQEQSPSKEIL